MSDGRVCRHCKCINYGCPCDCPKAQAQRDESFLASRDPAIDWQTAQQHGLFQVAADLVRDHARFLAAGAGGKVVVLEERRERRA